jgi:5'-phosphate synthase pdxT subunit
MANTEGITDSALCIGVLGIQGAVSEHEDALKRADETVQVVIVRSPSDLDAVDGLIIPGGESTTISINLKRTGLFPLLQEWISGGRPTLGTCAGIIIMSKVSELGASESVKTSELGVNFTSADEYTNAGEFTGINGFKSLLGGLDCSVGRNYYESQTGGLDCLVERNYYGSQTESFISTVTHLDDVPGKECKGIFIRAPVIKELCSEQVRPLAAIDYNGETQIVAVKQGNLLGTTFHPELTKDSTWHRYFLNMVQNYKKQASPKAYQ